MAALWHDVRRYVGALVDAGSAEDLTQETFLRAHQALSGFAGRSSLRTWLIGIARHVCADHIRAGRRQRNLHTRLQAQPNASSVPDATYVAIAADLIRRLPPARRAAFVLTQMYGLPYAETAALIAIPEGTVRSRVSRARDQLLAAWHDPAGR